MHDLIVIGSGIAGLFTALAAWERGARDLVILTKGQLQDSATRYAQGGIASAFNDGDSPDLHEADTIAAGAGLCDPAAVHILVNEGVERVADLIRYGVRFDTENGELHRALEAAHSMARVLHAGGDATGKHIERALAEAVRARGVTIVENAFVTALQIDAGLCRGVHTAGHGDWQARAVVLSTGGGGQLFTRTTNPTVSTADGVALALQAGAVVADLEFFQFHPTAFAPAGAPASSWRFLVSEAVRGHGAVLRDDRGVAFMAAYDSRAELAPRDVVARSMVHHMLERDLDHVWLDATRLADFSHHFPTIDDYCRRSGIDPARQTIPVAPAAHYQMGGVWTDPWGRSSIDGLYASGECASTGVHGANRLASNSLLEGIVFGSRVAQCVTDPDCAGRRLDPVVPLTVDRLSLPGGRALAPQRADVQREMWQRVGILRDGHGLVAAERRLAGWAAAPAGLTLDQRETANLALTGWIMAAAARRREESRGAHFRADWPAPRDAWDHRQYLTVDLARRAGTRQRSLAAVP